MHRSGRWQQWLTLGGSLLTLAGGLLVEACLVIGLTISSMRDVWAIIMVGAAMVAVGASLLWCGRRMAGPPG